VFENSTDETFIDLSSPKSILINFKGAYEQIDTKSISVLVFEENTKPFVPFSISIINEQSNIFEF